jgi:hypothetical protein
MVTQIMQHKTNAEEQYVTESTVIVKKKRKRSCDFEVFAPFSLFHLIPIVVSAVLSLSLSVLSRL